MPIYTRTGDDGTTSLFGGKRVLKCEELVDVYGSIDELNSWIGTLTMEWRIPVQEDLCFIASVLAGSKPDLDVLDKDIRTMEQWIDEMDSKLPKLTHFILPQGQMHIARSICRRVERQTVALSKKQHIDPVIIRYLNRLADLLFVLARYINKGANIKEIVWLGKDKRKSV